VTDDARTLVADARNYEQTKANPDYWEGFVTNSTDPSIELSPVRIDADTAKFLYVKLATESGSSMQIFFSGGEPVSERLSFRSGQLITGDSPVVYRFDLSHYKLWKGVVRNLRVDTDGCNNKTRVRLYGVGLSTKALDVVDGMSVVESTPADGDRPLDTRMAAWHDTMVATDEMTPNSCMSTYVKERFSYMDSYLLAKFSVGVEIAEKVYWPSSAQNVRVEDFPGGVRATYRIDGVEVTTEILPQFVGRDKSQQVGAAIYSVKTLPPTKAVVRCGSSAVNSFAALTRSTSLRASMWQTGDSAIVKDSVGLLTSTQHPFTVAVKGTVLPVIEQGPKDGQILSFTFPKGQGTLAAAFAINQSEAVEIAAHDTGAARRKVTDYYNGLLKCKIETPEKVMDQAFRSALYNLEYNWLQPYGWNECIHHWLALWHMQHTGAAEWIGQADRSRICNITTADNLMSNGAVPQFMPNGSVRRDFGGSNQFFAWQVRHYWRFTGDRRFVEHIAPKLDKVIAQTFSQYDGDRDGLLSWGQQIGNQEDYISTPYDGTSPAVEGINMLRTGAEFARVLGQREKAERYDNRADMAVTLLREKLWQSDLGRSAYYVDPTGSMRLDGQYHSLIYPVIWGLLDPLDSWTSIRHLRDRLIGKEGECYVSNNFPNHVVATVGTQAGLAQQPWAAWGLAAVGLREETWRPLKVAAGWVMDKNHRGSWPEVSVEPCPAYFSPPAGLYVQSTIEALFGLKVDKTSGCLLVAPSFPDHWPSAKLSLPDYRAVYARKSNNLSYTVTSSTLLSRKLRWMLPPCAVESMTVNGRPVDHKLVPSVDCVVLEVNTGPSRSTTFDFRIRPTTCKLTFPSVVAEHDQMSITANGCRFISIDDRCSVLSSFTQVSGSKIRVTVKDGLLDTYKGFGRLGIMNFSRRTFFLNCVAPGGIRFWKPITVNIVPKYECATTGEVEYGKFGLVLRNNSSSRLKGAAVLKASEDEITFNVDIPARSERKCLVKIPAYWLSLLSPGENHAVLVLPGKSRLDLTLVLNNALESVPVLGTYANSRIKHIALPVDSLIPDTDWRKTRVFSAYGHMPWAGLRPPMESLAEKLDLSVPGLSKVSFKLEDRKFAPVSWETGRPALTVNVNNLPCRKVYLLVIPFLDNHDTFSKVARVDVRGDDGTVISRTLHFPGDLDWWCPQDIVGDFATARTDRPDRFGLLPVVNGDWLQAKPPAFPQPAYWASCIAFKTQSAVMNVVEIDLGRVMIVGSIIVSTIGVAPSLGVVGVSVETSGGQDILAGTTYMPPARLREPRPLFHFITEGDLKGWRTEGNAFSVSPAFGVTTLNSLTKSGESATGKAFSPDFTIGPDDALLLMQCQGGNSTANDGPGTLAIRLVDSNTGEILENMQALGSHLIREGNMQINKWRGRKVHIELVDLNTGSSYAWLGLCKVDIATQ